MQKLWVRFGREVDGQDLLEYTLVLAAILLASVALMMNIAPGASAIWMQTTATLNQADGGRAAARVTGRKLPDAGKEASPDTAESSTAEVVVVGATVAVLSWLLWHAETTGPVRPDPFPAPQPKKLTEAAVLWPRRPTDPDKPVAN